MGLGSQELVLGKLAGTFGRPEGHVRLGGLGLTE